MRQLSSARAAMGSVRRGVIVGLLVALAVAGMVSVAGCGGGDLKDSDAVSRASSTPRTTASSSPASDVRGPRAALIGLDDLSAGWKKEPRIDVGLSCGSFDPFSSAAKVVDTGSFHRGYAYLQETVGVFADEESSSRAYRTLVSANGERCVRQVMHQRMQFASGASTAFVTPVLVGRVDRLGPQSKAVRYSMTFRGEVGTGEAYIVVFSARAGLRVASLTSIVSFEPLAEEAYAKLGELVAEHLESTT